MDTFSAIAEPIRREILLALKSGPHPAGAIASRFTVTPSAISQHLRALRSARLIQMRAHGQRRIYSIDPRGFRRLRSWLNSYRAFWDQRLDELEHVIRKEASIRSLPPSCRASHEPARTHPEARLGKEPRSRR